MGEVYCAFIQSIVSYTYANSLIKEHTLNYLMTEILSYSLTQLMGNIYTKYLAPVEVHTLVTLQGCYPHLTDRDLQTL